MFLRKGLNQLKGDSFSVSYLGDWGSSINTYHFNFGAMRDPAECAWITVETSDSRVGDRGGLTVAGLFVDIWSPKYAEHLLY